MQLPRIAFIGGGNMASSIIGGLIAGGFSAANICASDPHQETLDRLREIAPVTTTDDNATAVADADVVVMAVKPQILKTVAGALAGAVQARRPLIVSIAAGVRADSLEQWLGGNLAVVRCMPNTPALVRKGATALYANARVSDTQKQQAHQILEAVGLALWVDSEDQLDAVTAVSGSGPAYFFLVIEAMQQAGEKLGLDSELSRQLTLQTALGAATMALDSDVDAAELRRRVTSPNGTTERAVNMLEDGGIRELFLSALDGAKQRSEELAQEMDEA